MRPAGHDSIADALMAGREADRASDPTLMTHRILIVVATKDRPDDLRLPNDKPVVA